jgi:hypothetical protein
MMASYKSLLLAVVLGSLALVGCGSRQVQDSLVGSTAQRLVTHAIDEMIKNLPAEDFEPLRGQTLLLQSHFIERDQARAYADQRLAVELRRRFDIQLTPMSNDAEVTLNVFYTSLATDQGLAGFYLPLGFVPGLDEGTRINLITLEHFHGVAELYYFIGANGSEHRSELLQGRTRTDALGLPIITIPLTTLD